MAALTRLVLTDFRNYEHLLLKLDHRPVVLTGENGAGKTNLLEAISLFAPGRGLRQAVLGDCARHSGPGGWSTSCDVLGEDISARLGTGIDGSPSSLSHRKCRIDGKTAGSPGAFDEYVQIIWLSPMLDRLFSGPASDRRRFVDRLAALFDPMHLRTISAYERAMAERNKLLGESGHQNAWLDGLEAQMAEKGVAMAASRISALHRLRAYFNRPNRSPDFPPAILTMEGEVEASLALQSAIDVEDAFRARLESARIRDQAAGRALGGPHRSDLATVHGLTHAQAADCSTGEQKALLISIILAKARLVAQNRTGDPPILLLDEVTAHLDERRRNALFDEIRDIHAQAWMTGTDIALFNSLQDSAQFFTVDGGNLAESPKNF